ncbi:WG repeat-containing protein [Algoriphagus aquimarinus]|uniref:Uncharacterized protein n=1 Tax=Algoriphagus aquimarinus TaxID=237018 RepID=A0A5C7AUI7_9BACT|nr:WG repeat-containing protein [Algoriphagus aquimarinus]TXE12358.1 hypothetical protein ESV85_10025 [Algoriphagus aquimarinus]
MQIIKKDRYPGIRSFEADDERLFYGRTKEIDSLFSLVTIKPLIILFGKSGLGKTSLIKAGLGSLLKNNNFFPLMIRLQNTSVSPIDTVISELEPYVDKSKLEQFGGKSSNVIWEAINACNFFDPSGVPATPILIFDQFEELFNHDISLRHQWASQLSDLIEGRRPKDVVEILQLIPRSERTAEQLEWFEPPLVKILFSIRSDRMSDLHQLRSEFPGILQNRFELKPLQVDQAKEAIIKPATLIGNEFSSIPFEYETETVNEILENLKNETGEIESFQLQIICQHIEKYVKSNKWDSVDKVTINTWVLDGKEGIALILRNYYLDNIADLGSKGEQLAARKLLEEGLIADGRRIGVAEAVVKGTFKIDDKLLGRLLLSRLIRPEDSRLGRTYEISHDTLVVPILDALKNRRFVEEYRKDEEEKKQLKIGQIEMKKKQKRSYLVILVSIIFLVTFLVLYLNQKEATDRAFSNEKRVQTIIDAIYFYENRFALASRQDTITGKIKYGFINKQGEPMIDYKYDEASAFDNETEFAKVVVDGKKFWIDTTEVKYTLAESFEELNEFSEALDLRRKELEIIPNTIARGSSLLIVQMDQNELQTLPPQIGHLTLLYYLNLEENQLKSLPAEIGKLEFLRILILSNNSIETLPIEIGSLLNLESLFLEGNELKTLPPDIGELENLSFIHLENNSIETLPSEIGKLEGLQYLLLGGNPISEEEKEKIRNLLPNCEVYFDIVDFEN